MEYTLAFSSVNTNPVFLSSRRSESIISAAGVSARAAVVEDSYGCQRRTGEKGGWEERYPVQVAQQARVLV